MTEQEVQIMLESGKIDLKEAFRLLKEIAKEKKPAGEQPLYTKVSQKGGISVYNLQRLPVTLYVSQWEKLIRFMPQMVEFIKVNEKQLSRKGTK